MATPFDEWRSRSPFYDQTHHDLAMSVREFVTREITPNADKWEEVGDVPRELQLKAGEAGIIGLGQPEEFGGVSEGVTTFHHLVKIEELAAAGYGGITAGLINHDVVLPAFVRLGDPEVVRRVAPQVISGEKIVAIAVTEPSGGSDVARISTRAVREGDEYVITGSKTFITNGMRADYILVAARTGEEGTNGLSFLLVEVPAEGLTRTKLDKMGWRSSDTATLYFDRLRVPVSQLVGAENSGFGQVMRTFNFERLSAAQQANAYARVALAEAVRWARERETFGQRLGEHQVIRSKLADMVRHIEATQAWIDLCAWRFDQGSATPAELALLKVQATRSFETVTRECAQVLGGASYMTGSAVERLYREVRVLAIGGGSEEILLDLAGRQLGFHRPLPAT